MINFKKGNGHSLKQTDKLGNAKVGEGVVAGMVVHVDSNGDVIKGGNAATNLLGFAANDQTDSDVIESGKIGMIMLDGNTVIETDQVTITTGSTINFTDFPIGAAVTYDSTTGNVIKVASTERVLGYVEGIRTLPNTVNVTQSYKNIAGTTLSNTVATQKFVNVLGIKLAV